MISLNEESKEFISIKEKWHEEARNQTLESLPNFISDLMDNYQHDYGTVCHAIATAALAAAWATNSHKQGGITGFQAGAVMWEFIRQWNYSSNKTGLKIINYDDMLYPQCYYKFNNTISAYSWGALRKEAQRLINEYEVEYEEYLTKNEIWEKDMKDFVQKYPDYYENRSYYDRIGMGTADEWEAEKEKEEAGFEFSPSKPYDPRPHPDVLKHWESIVSGDVPFGFTIEEN